MKEVVVQPRLTDSQADALIGARMTAEHYTTVYRQPVRLMKPNGDPLAVYLPAVISPELCTTAYRAFEPLHNMSRNRGIATTGMASVAPLKKDGARSKTRALSTATLKRIGLDQSTSAVAGYMDRYPRMPYCRLTAYSQEHRALFESAMPYIHAVGAAFREHVPERFRAQMEVVERTSPDFVIAGTPFTTITVNKNFATRVHKDAGDLKSGFGVLSFIRRGLFRGGLFVLPKWGAAFDCGNGDVLLADVHEWHGNTLITGKKGEYERVSFVMYYREKMGECGTADQELERAKQLRS